MRTRHLLLIITLLSGAALACGDDPAPAERQQGNNNNKGDGDDEGDGDEGDGDEGDGDGDKDTGDGDGDKDTGDGDADEDDAAGIERPEPGEENGEDGPDMIRGDAPTAASASAKGPYKEKSYTMGLRAPKDYGGGTVWYPTEAEPPYAIVAVVPGFVSVQGQIANWGSFLASHGIVSITIDTVTGLDDPSARAKGLLDALKTVEEENTREGSPLKGKLNVKREGTIGWSMGGGGSLLVAEANPWLKAAISLAGWNPGHSYAKVTVPSMLLAVKTDALAGGQSQGFYSSIPESTPKFIWEVDNNGAFFGGHDTFNDPASLEYAAGRYGLSWIKVFVEGDERYKQFLTVEPPKKTFYETNQ
jgi:dienelactone hydrolase